MNALMLIISQHATDELHSVSFKSEADCVSGQLPCALSAISLHVE